MSDRPFYVQLHLHTAESSPCGEAPAAEMIRACKDAGYSMVVVTDHFMNTRTGADAHRPWREVVDALMLGYRAAKAEGDRIGLNVQFGWEKDTEAPELLTYGLGEEFLLANPDIMDLNAAEYIIKIQRAGGFVSHAHPYRQAESRPFVPVRDHLDAYEVVNTHHAPELDVPALRDARQLGLIELGGADAHHPSEAANAAMELPWPVEDMAGLIEALKSRQCTIVRRLPQSEVPPIE